MASTENPKLRELADLIAKGFVAAFAFAYVSGYLIVGAHLEALGIRSSGMDIAKAKYIWIGFMYLLQFLFLTVVTAFLYMSSPKWIEKLIRFWPVPRQREPSPNKYVVIVLCMTLLLGSRMIFFTAHFREETEIWLCLAMWLLFLHQLVHRVELFQNDWIHEHERKAQTFVETHGNESITATELLDLILRSRVRMRYCKSVITILYVVPLLFTYLLRGKYAVPGFERYRALFGRPPWSDGFHWCAFALTLICLHMQVSTAFHREAIAGRDAHEHTSVKRARWVVRAVMLLLLFFGSIQGFAHLVYPLIPLERGGGKYSTGAVVDICLKQKAVSTGDTAEKQKGGSAGGKAEPGQQKASQPFCTEGTVISDVIVLEQEPDALYVASIHDSGLGAAEVHGCGIDGWHEGIMRPGIIAFNAGDVLEVRETDTVEHSCRELRNPAKPVLEPLERTTKR